MKCFHPRPLPVLACAASLLLVLAAHSQERERPRPGLLRELRNRLSLRAPEEIWQEARSKPRATDALPLMESLAGRGGNSPHAAAAALWLGHYHYGEGRITSALGYFDQAASHADEEGVLEEARFWAAQSRNLQGEEPARARDRSPVTPAGVLADLARHDGELRAGDFEAALHGYLALEGTARQMGCLGPLLYRVGLVAAAGSAQGDGAAVDWDLIERWEAASPSSPERALVAAIAATSRKNETALPPLEDSLRGPQAQPGFAEPPAPGPAEDSLEAGTTGAAAVSSGEVGDTESEGEARRSLGETEEPADAFFSVQLGAFRDRDHARSEMERLVSRGLSVRLDRESSQGTEYFKIRLGRTVTREEAEDLAERLCRGLDWQVVRISP